jgi:YVTN family beta-propeller protein
MGIAKCSRAKTIVLISATWIAACLPACSQSLRLYVDNSRGDSISVVDLSTFKLVDNIKVGEHPHGLAIAKDGATLFATTELDHTLKVVDLRTGKITGQLKVQGKPNQCAVTPDGKYVIVPIRDGDAVDIVNLATLKIEKVLPIKEPHNGVSTASNRFIYVSSMGGHEVDIIDLGKLDYSQHIHVGGRPRPFVVSSDQKTMYVALANLHGFVKIDIRHDAVIHRIEIPIKNTGPARPHPFETPDTRTHGLALTPNEKELWFTSLQDSCVYIYDLEQQTVVGNVVTGDGPNWIIFSPNGKLAAVSNTDSNDVSIIDVAKRVELARTKVGAAPKRLAVGLAVAR